MINAYIETIAIDQRLFQFMLFLLKNEEASKAYDDREKYLKLKQDIKNLVEEEKRLRKILRVIE